MAAAPATSEYVTCETIPLDGWVIVEAYSGVQFLRRAHPSVGVRVGKRKHDVSMEGVIGAPYGSMFEVQGKALVRIPARDPQSLLAQAAVPSSGLHRDNRAIPYDAPQDLNSESIANLVKSGKSGEAIVDALASSLSSFEAKSSFAQAKYVARKKAKFSDVLTCHKPTGLRLAATLFSHSPRKMCFLRPDSLAQALGAANVRPHARIALVDATNGVVVGACLERMGGNGTLLDLTTALCPQLINLRVFPWAHKNGVDSHIKDPLVSFSLQHIVAPHLDEAAKVGPPPFGYGQAHGLLIVTKDDPFSVFMAALPMLGQGEPFTVFSPCAQDLVEIMEHLYENDLAVGLRVSKNFQRVIQVLPDRTHPEVNMHSAPGYLLIGYFTPTQEWHDSLPPLVDTPPPPKVPFAGEKRSRGEGEGEGEGEGGDSKRQKMLDAAGASAGAGASATSSTTVMDATMDATTTSMDTTSTTTQ